MTGQAKRKVLALERPQQVTFDNLASLFLKTTNQLLELDQYQFPFLDQWMAAALVQIGKKMFNKALDSSICMRIKSGNSQRSHNTTLLGYLSHDIILL